MSRRNYQLLWIWRGLCVVYGRWFSRAYVNLFEFLLQNSSNFPLLVPGALELIEVIRGKGVNVLEILHHENWLGILLCGGRMDVHAVDRCSSGRRTRHASLGKRVSCKWDEAGGCAG